MHNCKYRSEIKMPRLLQEVLVITILVIMIIVTKKMTTIIRKLKMVLLRNLPRKP